MRDYDGLTSWADASGRAYSVILGADGGGAEEALRSWAHHKGKLGTVEEVLVAQRGIPDLPLSPDHLTKFLVIGSTGTALALSGVTCGYRGTGPAGAAAILRELGVGEVLVPILFDHAALRFVRLEDRWMVEVGE